MKLRAHLISCLAIAVLAACGGSDSTSSDEALPLAVGNQWKYQYSVGFPYLEDGVATYEVNSTTKIDGVDAFVMSDDFWTDGTTRTTPYATSTSAVTQFPASDATSAEIADGHRVVVRTPLKAGDSWTNVSRTVDMGYDYDEDGTNEVEVTESRSVVGSPVNVSTPAGNFSNAYPIETTHRRQFMSPVSKEVFDTEQSNLKEWYVVGVGVVRRETYRMPYGGWREFNSTEVLSAYRIR